MSRRREGIQLEWCLSLLSFTKAGQRNYVGFLGLVASRVRALEETFGTGDF